MVAVKALILKLLNVIEAQTQLIGDLQNENQSLKDEINRLKSEKGKPKSPPEMAEKKKDTANGDKKKDWHKRAKKQRIKKLNPLIDYHRIPLQEFLTRVWAFYDRRN
jgi:predicted RNase H-like nuclease (RuvC/YqgF family)